MDNFRRTKILPQNISIDCIEDSAKFKALCHADFEYGAVEIIQSFYRNDFSSGLPLLIVGEVDALVITEIKIK